jgi:prepilin-type N-terminal cleavage/methylation domain-containing protein
MRPTRRGRRGQAGYTLVEVVVTTAIAAIVMGGLTSVVWTSWVASTTASGHIEASNQIRDFENFAYDDFARSAVPTDCTVPPRVCVQLNGFGSSGAPIQVTYTWDGAANLDRQANGNAPRHVATNVTAFSWSLDGSAPYQTCVVQITIAVGSFSESQVFRFYPRLQP